MFKKLSCKIFLIATFLLVTLPMGAATTSGEDGSEKVVMQDSDPNAEHYFNNRRALVGSGCLINRRWRKGFKRCKRLAEPL